MPFDFEQNQTVDNLDTVPEDFKGFYTENNEGGFALREEFGSAVKVITGLNKSLLAARKDAKKASESTVDLSPLAEYGDSVETIQAGVAAKLDELTSQLKGGEKAKIDLDKARDDWAKTAAKEREGLENSNAQLRGQIHKLLITDQLKSAIGDRALNPDLVIPFAEERARIQENEGKFSVVFVDEDNAIRYGTGGAPLTPKEFVDEMSGIDKYKPLFKSTVPEGSGARPGASSRRPAPTTGDKTANEKIADGLRQLESRR